MKFKLAGISLLALAVCSNAMAQGVISNININGLQRVEKETALSYAGINTNKPVSTEELNEALKRLYDTGLFSDISFDTKGNTLVINVKENPVKFLNRKSSPLPAQFSAKPKFNKTFREFWTSISVPGDMAYLLSRKLLKNQKTA